VNSIAGSDDLVGLSWRRATTASLCRFAAKVLNGWLRCVKRRGTTDGEDLDGGKTCKLSVPQPVPQTLFWSIAR
jgi:hypothetical protein